MQLSEELFILRWRFWRWLRGIKSWHVLYLPTNEYLGTRSARTAEDAYAEICDEAGPEHDTLFGGRGDYRIVRAL